MTCELCHRPGDSTWHNGGGSGFNHAAVFPLVGNHGAAACDRCHRNNVYRGTTRECAGCHLAAYHATQTPNHAAAGFPTTCESCHRATDPQWRGGASGAFNHNAVFALVGVHATQACAACHRINVFRGTARECAGCHLANYHATQTPNHAAAGFPTACEACHRASDPQWRGASFNHTAVFALVGRHASTACTGCHVNNVYRGTPRDCVGCHLGNYTATRSPNHMAAGFPTSCQSCHRASDASWTQGQFTHTRFPLSGPHNVPCAQCHTAPNNFAQFACTACHERAKTDGDHRGEPGYRYDSVACYSCHPNGRH
jgi:hypothetical protein